MMSLCGLFLLEVSKRVDAELGVPSRSSSHAVRDAEPDIHRMTSYLMEEKVARVTERDEPFFDNPFTKGAQKIAGDIEKYLNGMAQDDNDSEGEYDITFDDVDFMY